MDYYGEGFGGQSGFSMDFFALKVRGWGALVQAQKLDFLYFLTVKSSTFVGIITFYRMRISFDTLKILAVKVRTYCQIYGIFNTI